MAHPKEKHTLCASLFLISPPYQHSVCTHAWVRIRDWGKLYPNEFAEYRRQCSNQGKFYGRLPLGESPFDVAIRIHQFMGTIYRDYEKHGGDTLFIFTHGTTLRTFPLRRFHYSPEWYQAEKNPKNCWIREIDGQRDCGYINN